MSSSVSSLVFCFFSYTKSKEKKNQDKTLFIKGDTIYKWNI